MAVNVNFKVDIFGKQIIKHSAGGNEIENQIKRFSQNIEKFNSTINNKLIREIQI